MKLMESPELDMLLEAILTLHTKEECRRFLEDICTIKELEALIEAYTATGIEFVENTYDVYYTNPITNRQESIKVVSYSVNTNTATNGVSIDSALALIDMKIAQFTEQLNIQQALAEQYKEHLNTLLGMSEDETPETPAEDETPSEEQPAA